MTHAPDPPVSGLGRRRSAVAVVLIVAVLAAVAGWVLSGLVRSPAQAAADAAAPPPSVITATVEQRVLRSQVVTRGQVVTSRTVTVSPEGLGGEGTPVVTAVRVRVGQKVRPGQLLMSVSGRPVVVLHGKIPAYRDLRPGDTGSDVTQLQRALGELGYSIGGDRRGHYGSGTAQAVEKLYSHLGFRPQPASPDDAQVVQSAQDAVTGAQRALTAQREAVADQRRTLRHAKGRAARAEARRAVRDARREQGYAQSDLDRAEQELGQARASTGPMLPRDEVVFLPTSSGRVQKVAAVVGGAVPSDAIVLSTGDLLVAASLDALDEPLVRAGQRVELYSEVLDRSVAGAVTSLTTRPPGGVDDEGGGVTYAVITPDRALPTDFADQDVRVTINAASSDGAVMVVPVSALSSGADGRTTVTVLGPDGAQRRVAVVTLVDADGFVGIRPENPDDLAVGAEVVVGVRDETPTGSDAPSPSGSDEPDGIPVSSGRLSSGWPSSGAPA